LLASTAKSKADIKRANPESNYGLGVCKVINLDYEAFLVTLRTVSGTAGVYDRVPVPLTFPGAGARHFFGALPEIGDFCIVGWVAQESSQPTGTKTPIILAWMNPGVAAGQDWLTTAEIEQDEYDQSPADRTALSGAYDRTRHKLRHMGPGNIVASSSQGSDLVLDEGVTLANRRGNEIRLRDQDQAFIVRSLQQFHAMAGARIYGGMVQRDATFLPAMLVSDGYEWDGATQSVAGTPVSSSDLPIDARRPAGLLTPAVPLQRMPLSEGGVGSDVAGESAYLNPYQFLQNGGFITPDGFAADEKYRASANYGGKSLFRVMSQDTANAVNRTDAATLTEYRIEVNHTSDGRLPVTEQTEGFDADRLPDQDTSQPTNGLRPGAPFIEFVMGSVIGNDPFTVNGRKAYGLPLVARIFDGNIPNPRLDPAAISTFGSNTEPTPMKEQLATLFKLTPPMKDGTTTPTFWGLNKQGQMRAAFGGATNENSVEAYLSGGLKLGVGGTFTFINNGHLSIGTKGKKSLYLEAEKGAVRIFGGGGLQTPEAQVESFTGSGHGSRDLPAVDIEAATNVRIKAEREVLVKAGRHTVNASQIELSGHKVVNINSGLTSISTDTFQKTVSAKAVETYMGPELGLPTGFPLHQRIYAPLYPGIAEDVRYGLGANRNELFMAGNHLSTVLVGNMAYALLNGVWAVTAMTSALTLGPAGINGVAAAGAVTLTAASGAAAMTGLTAAGLFATGGVAVVRGSAGVYLGGPVTGPDVGPIIAAGSLEPFTGLPFLTWGMGAKAHLIGP
jgi:hypothetical protein